MLPPTIVFLTRGVFPMSSVVVDAIECWQCSSMYLILKLLVFVLETSQVFRLGITEADQCQASLE